MAYPGFSAAPNRMETSKHTAMAARRLAVGTLMSCWALAAAAQEGQVGTGGIMGTVRDSTGERLIGVRVVIPGSELHVETDDSGSFHLVKVRPGMLSLRFLRLGFRPDTVKLMVLAGRTVPLDLVLTRLATQLSPVVVIGRSELTGWRREFYQRRQVGGGHFFTRDDIEKRNPSFMTDMLRNVPGVRIRPSQGIIQNQVRFRNSGNCPPLTWLDGAPLPAGEFDLDALSPRSIEAMEVYPGSTVPPRFAVSPGIGQRTCGVIVLWSREGQRPVRKRTSSVSPAAELASLVDDRQIYTAAQVDVTAHQDSSRTVRPIYPDELLDNEISGTVMVEFIVDPTGQVDTDRLSVVFATHPEFVRAVREALENAIYIPAVKDGNPVHQLVQHEFRFIPDTAQIGKRQSSRDGTGPDTAMPIAW